MVDLQGKDRGNISLPPALQGPDFEDFKSADIDDYPMMMNMQRAVYEHLIADLQQKIERLQTRNEELEKLCDLAQSQTEPEEDEVEKKIIQLNNSIFTTTKRIDDLKKKCDDVEEVRKKHATKHLERMKEKEDRFHNTKLDLVSEIKLLNSKINAIDDFRSVEESLREKYNKQNELIMRKEEEMEQKLNDVELKLKIHKENLKKECNQQVLHLSEKFQLELKETIPQNVQRLMRQNIILENELVQLWNDHSNMADKRIDYQYGYEDEIGKIREATINKRRQIITCKLQSVLLERIRKAHIKVRSMLSKSFEPPKKFERKYQKIVEKARNLDNSKDEIRRRKLEVLLHQERIKLNLTNQYKSKTSAAVERCTETLNTLKRIVNAALLMNKYPADQDYSAMDLETISVAILNAIETWEIRREVSTSESVQTIPDSSNVYAIGDLGFEPREIDTESIEKIGKTDTSSVESTLEILKELQKLAVTVDDEQKKTDRSSSSESLISDAGSVVDVVTKQLTEKEKELSDFDYDFEGEEYEYEFDDFDFYMNY
ncbi:hypothetical protein QAD02_004195 [Eretmocerus hayati]|uniref:Uncharacterized protein n=2 Tax=Eretmocerus hayati TaxID=131215 RepID=A0ACC2NRJ9_9HYME|nr:hypothetical protein QAD02_004190 [Eretmocerus hayati]KAJ8672934.1 hypothetical protein QAD02_004195 [Eretmocerus hayati]